MATMPVPPHSEAAESSVLGSILIDRDAIVEVAEFLRPDHFYREAHRHIFAAMLSLYEEREPIDVVTVAEQLRKQKQLAAVGDKDYLATLVEKVPTAGPTEVY